jgi:hypothetical protein
MKIVLSRARKAGVRGGQLAIEREKKQKNKIQTPEGSRGFFSSPKADEADWKWRKMKTNGLNYP